MIQGMEDIKAVGFRCFKAWPRHVDMFKGRAKEIKAIIDFHQVYPLSFYFWNRGDSEKDIRTVQEALDCLAANNIRSISVHGFA